MRHHKIAVFVHMIWATWDRLPLLAGDVEASIHRAIGAKRAELDVELVAMGGIEDHIHLLIQLPSTLSIADAVKHIKGISGHLIAHKTHPQDFFRWQGSYAAFSVSVNDLDMVANSIKRQREHHSANTLIPAMELDETR
jgi:REP element-mobilizing transposase RayT